MQPSLHTALHTHCVTPPDYVQLCNPHRIPLCLNCLNIIKQFLDITGTVDITLHNKSTFLSPAHTHTQTQHTHTHVIFSTPLYLVPLKPKYSPQHPIFKHPDRTFFAKYDRQISPGVKVAAAYGWIITTLVVSNVKTIRDFNLHGTLWANSAFCGMTFTFTFTILMSQSLHKYTQTHVFYNLYCTFISHLVSIWDHIMGFY